MSREDGSIGADIVPEILIGHQLDAAQHGARQFTEPVGTPGEIARDTADGVKDSLDDTVAGVQETTADSLKNLGTATAQGGADIRLTYDGLITISNEVRTLADDAWDTAKQVARTLQSSHLRKSTLLSPITAGKVTALGSALVAQLTTLAKTAEVLAPAWAAILTTFQAADSALAVQLQAVRTGARTVGSVTQGIAQVNTELAVGAVRMPVSVAASVLGAVSHVITWRVSMAAGVASIVTAAVGGAGVSATKALLTSDWQRWFTPSEFEKSTGQFLDSSGLGSDAIVKSLALAWKAAGHGDTGITDVTLTPDERRTMSLAQQTFRTKLRGRLGLDRYFKRPQSVADLLSNAGEIDAMGANHTSVIRVIVKESDPPRFTLIMPSTKHWYSNSAIPNDLASNIAVMSGADSALLLGARRALDAAVARYSDVSQPEVVVVGFSQGGITAARFAEQFHTDYEIKQVITAGAPISRISIPRETSVLSLENGDDQIVPRLDLRPNIDRGKHRTVRSASGGHDAVDYAVTAAELVAEPPAALRPFLFESGDRAKTHDHFVRRKD